MFLRLPNVGVICHLELTAKANAHNLFVSGTNPSASGLMSVYAWRYGRP